MRTVDFSGQPPSEESFMALLVAHGLDWTDPRYPIYGSWWTEEPDYYYQAENEAEQALLDRAAGVPLLVGLCSAMANLAAWQAQVPRRSDG
jgi:hypothetical protein